MANVKERILKAAREKTKSYLLKQGNLHKVIRWFSNRNAAGQREWQYIFKVLKGEKNKKQKTLQPRIIYLAILPCRREGERKKFLSNKNQKEYSNTKPILKETVKSLF